MNINIKIDMVKPVDFEKMEYIGKLGAYLDEHLPEVFYDVALKMVTEAKANAPVKTGLLRTSIHAEVYALGVNIVCDVNYANYQEANYLFMQNAIYAYQDELREVLKQTIINFFNEGSET